MKGIRKILLYLREYIQKELNWGIVLFLGSFLALAIWFNYEYRFEKRILDSAYETNRYFFYNMAYYMAPYLVGALAIGLFSGKWDFWKKGGFWLVLLIFAGAQSIDSWYHWYEPFDLPRETRYLGRKLFAKVVRTSCYLLPILLFYLFVRKRRNSFFGLTRKGFDAGPYYLMMAIMIPALFWASFDPSFLKAYPTYQPGMAERYLDISPWITFIPYELLYATTFLALEILFRGFLIFEMEKFLGDKVVIPMVCVYCTLHFGKPMMECISSIFGGFILGVIALRTRSVYGGAWVHIFIALGMDLLAFLQEEYWMK